jgi:phosphoribosylaminoimidazolecarboxamide formyltransferase/IMP cyclohydrolase
VIVESQWIKIVCFEMISAQNGVPLEDRKLLATKAFHVSSYYDGAIYHFFTDETIYKASIEKSGQVLG